MTTDFLFRFATTEAFFDAMTALGVPVFPENEKPEEQLGASSSRPQVTHQGIIRTVRLWPEQVALIPDIILSPETVLIDWCSSEEAFEDAAPTYTHDVTDEDGNVVVATCNPGRIGS